MRKQDAECLLAGKQWSGAYYLTGYAVECALKACIAKRIRRYDFPDKELAFEVYTHNLAKLMRSAQLSERLQTSISSGNEVIGQNWAILQNWSEIKRYEFASKSEAEELFQAAFDTQNGIYT